MLPWKKKANSLSHKREEEVFLLSISRELSSERITFKDLGPIKGESIGLSYSN